MEVAFVNATAHITKAQCGLGSLGRLWKPGFAFAATRLMPNVKLAVDFSTRFSAISMMLVSATSRKLQMATLPTPRADAPFKRGRLAKFFDSHSLCFQKSRVTISPRPVLATVPLSPSSVSAGFDLSMVASLY